MGMLVFGGYFNPLHIGHMFLAEEIHAQYGYEPVVFVPSNIPAHKERDSSVTADQRYTMLELVAGTVPWMQVDDCELRRGGVSYSVDTIRELEAKYKPKETISLLIGDDLAEGFCGWKEVDLLARMVNIVIARRSGTDLSNFPYKCRIIENRVLDISSSDLRKRIREGKAYRYLLPEVVYGFIEREGMYRNS